MNRRSFLAFVLTAVLVFSFIPSASALYQWVDEQGNLHITDNPPPSKPTQEEPEAPRTPSIPSPARTPEAGHAPVPAATEAGKPASSQAQMPPPAPFTPAMRPAAPPQTQLTPTASAPETPAVKEAPRADVPSPFVPGNAPPVNVVTALFAGFMTVVVFIAIGVYVYFSLCLYLIANKLNVAESWAAWIPIIQVWPFLSSAGKPCWWVILLFIPFVNAVISVYLWMCIVENLGRNKWLGLLMLLPIINFVLMGVLAFSKEETGQQVAGT